MRGLFASRAFAGFGPVGIGGDADPPPLHLIQGGGPKALRRRVREDCPRLPGVYGMLNAQSELIYVGKAKNLRARLMCYFRPKSRDPKAGRILERTRTLLWEIAPCEFGALVRELELIQRWRPLMNVQGQPNRRRTFLCVGRKPAPYVFLKREPSADTLAYFGPIRGGDSARDAVRRLNDYFQLRDCPKSVPLLFADQKELFPVERTPACLRYELGTCAGPCVAACTRGDYAARVKAVIAFLAGKNQDIIDRLERGMKQASDRLEFERAAALRNKLEPVQWLNERLERMRSLQEQSSFVYPVESHDGETHWYLIHHGRAVAVFRRPATAQEWRAASAHLQPLCKKGKKGSDLPEPHEVDRVYLVASWFARHADEKQRLMKPAEALKLCRAVTRKG